LFHHPYTIFSLDQLTSMVVKLDFAFNWGWELYS
jgi:hypothetical protein